MANVEKLRCLVIVLFLIVFVCKEAPARPSAFRAPRVYLYGCRAAPEGEGHIFIYGKIQASATLIRLNSFTTLNFFTFWCATQSFTSSRFLSSFVLPSYHQNLTLLSLLLHIVPFLSTPCKLWNSEFLRRMTFSF